jgi:D-sedoheptulose 7-phosphate isomerase
LDQHALGETGIAMTPDPWIWGVSIARPWQLGSREKSMNECDLWISELNTSVQSTECHIGRRAASFGEAADAFASLIERVRRDGRTIWWAGNGGSFGICAHLAQDVLNKLNTRSMILSDPSLLTCMANDFGYEQVYSRPLRVLFQAGDVVILMSSSGKSANILNCARLAKERSVDVVAFSSFERTNPLHAYDSAIAFYVPSKLYGHAEAGHLVLLHAMIDVMMFRMNKAAHDPRPYSSATRDAGS